MVIHSHTFVKTELQMNKISQINVYFNAIIFKHKIFKIVLRFFYTNSPVSIEGMYVFVSEILF